MRLIGILDSIQCRFTFLEIHGRLIVGHNILSMIIPADYESLKNGSVFVRNGRTFGSSFCVKTLASINLFLQLMEIVEAAKCFFGFSILLWMYTAEADPANMIQNGDFNVEGFVFNQFPIMDVISTGINTLVPYWVAIEGGVQMLDSSVYKPPSGINTSTLLHLNYKLGPGKIASMPMYVLREGALYTVSCFLADNPDGGPLYKTMRIEIVDIFGKRLGPKLEPFVVSNHSTTQTNILWQTVALNVRGTGKPAYLTVDSDTPGSYGPLIASIQVSLSNIIENGSFEMLAPSIGNTNGPYFVVVNAPSILIDKWTVEAGALKIASAARYQASTDNSPVMLDLNAMEQPAVISNAFAIKPSTAHVILFDAAINPEQQMPMQGQVVVMVQGQPSASILLNKPVDMDSTGFSIDSIGWNTYEFPFTTGKDDIKVRVSFQSKIAGSFGPLLDNVCVYEVIKSLKDANETISDVPAGVAATNFNDYTKMQGEAQVPLSSCLSTLRFVLTGLIVVVLSFFQAH